MKLSDRVRLMIRSLVPDWGRGDPPVAAGDDPAALIARSEARLAALRRQLDGALARENRAAEAWTTARAVTQDLNEQVKSSMAGGRDDEARATLKDVRGAQDVERVANDTWRAFSIEVEKLRSEIDLQEARLARGRKALAAQNLAEQGAETTADQAVTAEAQRVAASVQVDVPHGEVRQDSPFDRDLQARIERLSAPPEKPAVRAELPAQDRPES